MRGFVGCVEWNPDPPAADDAGDTDRAERCDIAEMSAALEIDGRGATVRPGPPLLLAGPGEPLPEAADDACDVTRAVPALLSPL